MFGSEVSPPDWMDRAHSYLSRIEGKRGDPVRVMQFPDEVKAIDLDPGTTVLRLVPGFRKVAVVDADGVEAGVIRPRAPGFGHVMRRGRALVWTVSSRSFVMRRHALVFAGGEAWVVKTPFFWRMNVVCSHAGGTIAVGQVGSRKWTWRLWIAPERDCFDLIAALAFLHRRWWRH